MRLQKFKAVDGKWKTRPPNTKLHGYSYQKSNIQRGPKSTHCRTNLWQPAGTHANSLHSKIPRHVAISFEYYSVRSACPPGSVKIPDKPGENTKATSRTEYHANHYRKSVHSKKLSDKTAVPGHGVWRSRPPDPTRGTPSRPLSSPKSFTISDWKSLKTAFRIPAIKTIES